MSALARLDELLGRHVSMRAFAVVRTFAGPVVLLHLRPFLADASDRSIYRDAFYEPYASWYPELPRAMYVAVLWIGAAAAAAMTVGLFTRLSTAITLGVVAYNVFLSTTHFHSNRAYLLIVLTALAIGPCGRELSVDAWRRRSRGRPSLDPTAPAWPLWLLRFEAAMVYGASGLSKLVDPDWVGGTVTWQRVMRTRDRIAESPMPEWALSVLTDRSFHTFAAKVIVATELFIALGLCWRATRYAAVWVAVCFHVAIEVSASVQVFSYLGIAALMIWSVPSTRDRELVIDVTAAWPRRFARAVTVLDWLARFRVVHGPPGSRVRVTDRDGSVLTGGAAVTFVFSRMPLTAWFALPATIPIRRTPGVGAAAMSAGRAGVMVTDRTANPFRRLLLPLASTIVAVIVVFGALAPPERCPAVSADDLRRSAGEVVGWFTRNQQLDGTWLYLYDASTGEAADDYNIVRHSGVALGLYMAAAASIPGAFDSADRGLAWSLDRILQRDDWSAVTEEGERTSTGTTALLVAALLERRAATGDTRHDPLIERLGRFLVAQTEPSGAVLAYYDNKTGAAEPATYSKYYTGEAYWALTRLHRTFPHAGWGDVADRIGAYVAQQRDDVEDYWPPFPDHWAAYGLSETVAFDDRSADRPLTDAEAEYAREQAELFGAQVRWVSQRFGPWGQTVRGAHVPRGGGYGVVGEALTGLWRVADADPRLADLRDDIGERATCIAGLAIDAQTSPAEARSLTAAEQVQGAWFRDDSTRMDDQQHALAALLRTVAIVQATEAGGDAASDAASGWLWLAVLIAAFNPARATFAVPRGDRSRRSIAATAALGGAAASSVMVAVALVAGPVADALDVSDAALRLAVGIVGAVAGIVVLVRKPPAPEPALPGRWAAIIPVAVPGVLGPGLVLLTLGAGADRGLWVVVAAAVCGVAALAALAPAASTDGPGRRAVGWGGRVLAAAQVAASVLLLIDGVFAV